MRCLMQLKRKKEKKQQNNKTYKQYITRFRRNKNTADTKGDIGIQFLSTANKFKTNRVKCPSNRNLTGIE